MNKIYLMDRGFLTQLLDDRKDIMTAIKGLSAVEMRQERESLIDSLSVINVAPKAVENASSLYTVDDNGTATIPIIGELTPHAQTDLCGAYTAEALTEYGFIIAATEAAGADESVVAIDYFVDSPGGYHAGLMPAVSALRLVNKPTRAIVGDMAASAAYWLASQTDEIVALNESVRVGSIGVAVEEYDNTKQLENAGITRRVYASTDAPLKRPDTNTEEGQAVIQDSLDDLHGIFRKQVAEGRRVSESEVNDKFGHGGMLIAEDALAVGMIDRIERVFARQRQETITDVIGIEDNTAAKAGEIKQGVKMDLNILKTENSALFAEVVKIGVEQEKARQASLDEQLEADPGNSKLASVIADAKADGKSVSDIQTKLSVAVRDGKLNGENPPEVETAETKDKLSDDDLKAAKVVGMTLEEYRKFKEAN